MRGRFQEGAYIGDVIYMGLEGILFLVVCVYPQDLDPLPIVEVTLAIGKRAFEEFIDLPTKS